MWAPVDNGADAKCLEILQQQSDSISLTNKLLISSSTPEFQENSINNSYLLRLNIYKTKYIKIT